VNSHRPVPAGNKQAGPLRRRLDEFQEPGTIGE
jgi:hypothetical protein